MTSKEIQKLIKQNLINKIDSNLKIKGTYLLLYPIKDILGGFCFERSGFDKSSIYVWWFVQPLFVPTNVIYLTFGGRLEHENRSQSWTDLDSDRTIQDLVAGIQKNLGVIRSLSDPKLFFDYYKNRPFKENIRIYEAVVYTSIWISLPRFQTGVQDFIRYIDNNCDLSISWVKQIRDDMTNIEMSINPRALLESNKEHLLAMLTL